MASFWDVVCESASNLSCRSAWSSCRAFNAERRERKSWSTFIYIVGSVALDARGGSGGDSFCHSPFLPRAPWIDAPFPLSLLVRAQRATYGQLRDARLSCRARGEAFRAQGG